MSANVPPSPRLSARKRMSTYLQRNDDDQRPKDERQHSENRLARHGMPSGSGCGGNRFAQRIEGTCSDVAVYDPMLPNVSGQNWERLSGFGFAGTAAEVASVLGIVFARDAAMQYSGAGSYRRALFFAAATP